MYLGLGTMLIGFVVFVIARYLTVKKKDLPKKYAVALVDAATVLFEGNVVGFFFSLVIKKLGFSFNVFSATNFIVFYLVTFLVIVVASALFFSNVKMFKLTNYYIFLSEEDDTKFIDHFWGLPVIISLVWYFLYTFLL